MEKYELQKLRDLPIEGVAERLGIRVSSPVDVVLGEEEHLPLLRLRGSRRHDRPGDEVSE